MPEPEVTILVPCRNETGCLERGLRRPAAVFPENAELPVVDGGSDPTRQLVEALAEQLPPVRYLENPGDRGKGPASRRGCESAHGELVAQIDAERGRSGCAATTTPTRLRSRIEAWR